MHKHWSLQYEYRYPGGVRSDSINFSALDESDAVAAALRYMQGREKIPEFFTELLYFQIHPLTIGTIGPLGEYGTKIGFRLMEWSRDRAGVDKETYCEWKIAEWSRK